MSKTASKQLPEIGQPQTTVSNVDFDRYALLQIVAAVATTRSTTPAETVRFAKLVFDEYKKMVGQ